jgi:hypothetical protein
VATAQRAGRTGIRSAADIAVAGGDGAKLRELRPHFERKTLDGRTCSTYPPSRRGWPAW